MKDKLIEADLKHVITSLVDYSQKELYAKTQEELEEYWHFKWNDSSSDESNTYYFHDLLKLYGSFCRRWEEHHNGSLSVVERVRDTYLMPKIKEFCKRIKK